MRALYGNQGVHFEGSHQGERAQYAANDRKLHPVC
ncbi:hypothetical protein PSAC2689_100322 [Paraburkholderia sacchari]